jgi:glycogen synthase
MKLLLVGPYPPPHGGVSVHVRNAHAILCDAGVECGVLNIKGRTLAFFGRLLRYVFDDWPIHVHTNGHNRKSWLVAVACGLTAQMGNGGVLTLHSGLLPGYLAESPEWIRRTAQLCGLLYDRVVCVNHEIAQALAKIGVPKDRLTVMPAFLPPPAAEAGIPDGIQAWVDARHPLLTMTSSFRPEYGLELLISALHDLRADFPQIGCVVMGDGEARRNIEEDLRRYTVDRHVLFTGDLPYNSCLQLMSYSDVFVRPTFRDGDANSVREALALGTPVVASDVGHRPKGVHLFEPGNRRALREAIQCALREDSKRRKRESFDYTRQLLGLYHNYETSC